MTVTRTPPRFCPVCFNILDSITGLETENAPEPGDFSICLKCGAVLRVMMAPDGLDYALSSLMEIPVDSRLGFAQAVQAIEQLGGTRRYSRDGHQ